MALFKVSKGKIGDLPEEKIEDYYFVTLDGKQFFFELSDEIDQGNDSEILHAQLADKLQTPRFINGISFDGSSNVVSYGVCYSEAETVDKEVECNNFVLSYGAEITVKFDITNTAENPTLNVNRTGAKPIYYRGAAISPPYLATSRTYLFRYNGEEYEVVGDISIIYGLATEIDAGLMSPEDKIKVDSIDPGGLFSENEKINLIDKINNTLIEVDSEISNTSTNPVQNRAIASYINSIINSLSFGFCVDEDDMVNTDLETIIKARLAEELEKIN